MHVSLGAPAGAHVCRPCACVTDHDSGLSPTFILLYVSYLYHKDEDEVRVRILMTRVSVCVCVCERECACVC